MTRRRIMYISTLMGFLTMVVLAMQFEIMIYVKTKNHDLFTREEKIIYKTNNTDCSKEFKTSSHHNKHNSKTVLYNRARKCGSRSLIQVMNILAKKNGFSTFSSDLYFDMKLSESGLKELKDLLEIIPKPWIYDRHLYFVDFSDKQLNPIYINMIRDPVERFSSWYHFRRFGDSRQSISEVDEQSMKMNINDCILSNHPECLEVDSYIKYFCGQKEFCLTSSETSFNEAEKNLKKYLVVGFVEEFEDMLEILEELLPEFFKGAVETWSTIERPSRKKTSTSNKVELTEEARNVLKQRMKMDYRFVELVKTKYENIKDRLAIDLVLEMEKN